MAGLPGIFPIGGISTPGVDTSSPALIRDMTKCIRCQRCIAICRDGQGVDALVRLGVIARDELEQLAAELLRRGHPVEVLGEFGYSSDEINGLVDKGVVCGPQRKR